MKFVSMMTRYGGPSWVLACKNMDEGSWVTCWIFLPSGVVAAFFSRASLAWLAFLQYSQLPAYRAGDLNVQPGIGRAQQPLAVGELFRLLRLAHCGGRELQPLRWREEGKKQNYSGCGTPPARIPPQPRV